MAVTTLRDLVSAGAASAGLKKASTRLAASIAHIASGNRIASAYEDIASLAIGTQLRSQVTGLRQASSNIAEASSFLQVADGALGQSSNILDRMRALATQANSGVLSQAGRDGLNREFQQLGQELDRLSGTTNFNGVNLIDGSLSAGNGLASNTATATQATGNLNFTGNVGAGQTINLNGVTLTEGVDFAAGASVNQTIDNLANALNNSTNTALSGASYQRVGSSLQITFDAGGEIGNNYTINEGASTAAAAFNVGGQSVAGSATLFSLQGGTDNGVSGNSTTASGVVGDSLVSGLNNTAASTTLSFTSAANIVAGNNIQIDDGNGGFTTFTYVNGAPANNQQIQIGNTLEDTLANTASTLENFSGPGDYVTRQLDFSVQGNNIVITGEGPGNVNDALGAAANITETTGGTLSNAVLNNGSSGGINTSGITNPGFTGQIQGFSAVQTGANAARVSVDVGGVTYTANISNTNVAGNTTVRFSSQSGGFFDVTLAGGNGQTVGNQGDADLLSARFDSAFSGVSFSQNRDVTNFTAAGQLTGASLQIKSDDFSNTNIDSINVFGTPPGGGSASIEIKINGETFRATNLGNSIGAGESVTLTSLSNSNRTITFNNGVNRVDLSSQIAGNTFRASLEDAIGVTPGGGGASFQTGNNADDNFNVNIGDASTTGLFGSAGIGNLLSQGGAANALNSVGVALDRLTSLRADVGSYQSALNFEAANVDSAILNQDAARAVLLDTDFAAESTQLALASLASQAAIAAQVQTKRLAPSLLDLLKGI